MRAIEHINGDSELKRRIAICRKRVRRVRATQKALTMEAQQVASPAGWRAERTGDAFKQRIKMVEKEEAADAICEATEDECVG